MTNFEKLTPHIEALFGEDWDIEAFAQFYADVLSGYQCDGLCMVAAAIGEHECLRRMVLIPESDQAKCDKERRAPKFYKGCPEIIKDWLMEEAEP